MARSEIPSFLERDQLQHIYRNPSKEELLAYALSETNPKGTQVEILTPDGQEVIKGSLAVETGIHTARSPQDKYYAATEGMKGHIWEQVNKPLPPESFDRLFDDVDSFLRSGDQFVMDLALGADLNSPTRQLVQLRTHSAWHALFASNLYRELTDEERVRVAMPEYKPDLEILHAPGFSASPETHQTRLGTVVALDYEKGRALVTETEYGGEIKKLGLTWEHFVADREGHAVLHGSLIRKQNGKAMAIMGDSGTGKSTCAQIQIFENGKPTIQPVGDDEIVVDPNGIAANIEGGVYPSMGNINPDKEPEFFLGSLQPTSILENVRMFPDTQFPDFGDLTLTPNIRAAIDLDDMPNMDKEGIAGELEDIIILTADGRGVMPPVARLTGYEQAMFYLLSGRTSKMPGKEKGVTELRETANAMLAEPFLVREPKVHADAIGRIIKNNNVNVWIVNTGWAGGPYGVGERMDITLTQAIIKAIASNKMHETAFREDPLFGFEIPTACPGIDAELFDPELSWDNSEGFKSAKEALANAYRDTFIEKFDPEQNPDMSQVLNAGPQLTQAA